MRNKSILTKIITSIICIILINTFIIKGEEVLAINTIKGDQYNLMDWFTDVVNNKVYSNKIMVDDKLYGYIENRYTIDDLGKEIANIYIQSTDIKKEEVSSIDMKINILLKKESVNKDNIISINKIAEKIYSDRRNNNLSIKAVALKEENKTIESTTKYLKTKELYMGQSKSVEGTQGLKNITKLVTYTLDEEPDEMILEEEVVAASTANIVYEGERNPYIDGVAFLKTPLEISNITSYFGKRWGGFHKGIDFAGNIGDRVSAAINGQVIYAQYNYGGYGNLVILEHENNMKSYYAHLNSICVNVGDIIKKGEKIGEVGNTGRSTGPHLHFELRINDEAVDPLNYLY